MYTLNKPLVAGFSTLVLQRFADFPVVLPLPLDPDVKSITFVGVDLFLGFALDLVVTPAVAFLLDSPLLGLLGDKVARVEVAAVAERKFGLTPNELLTTGLLKLVVSKLEVPDDEVMVLLREGYTLGKETLKALPGAEEGELVSRVGPFCDELLNELYVKVPVDPNIKEAEAVGPAKYDCNGLSNGVLLIFLLVLKPCLVWYIVLKSMVYGS